MVCRKLIRVMEWTKEEENLLKKHYVNYTNPELVELFFHNRTPKSTEGKARRLGLPKKSHEVHLRLNKANSERKKEYYKTHDGTKKGVEVSKETREKMSKAKKKIGKWSGSDNPRNQNPLRGENNGNWKGGITDTYRCLRTQVKPWQRDSMKFCRWTCVVTRERFDDVRHIFAFKKIMDETFQKCGVKKERCSHFLDFSKDESDKIIKTILDIHYKYGFGAALEKNVHKLFHDQYGYTNYSPEDFLDFVNRIENGDYNEWFKENNLKININYNYINYVKDIIRCEEKVG